MTLVLAAMLVIAIVVGAAQAGETRLEREQVQRWRSLYETSAAGERELRKELADARTATKEALGKGTRLARRMHEMSEEIASLHDEIDASEEAISQALVDLKSAEAAIAARRGGPSGSSN